MDLHKGNSTANHHQANMASLSTASSRAVMAEAHHQVKVMVPLAASRATRPKVVSRGTHLKAASRDTLPKVASRAIRLKVVKVGTHSNRGTSEFDRCDRRTELSLQSTFIGGRFM